MYESLSPVWDNIFVTIGIITSILIMLALIIFLYSIPEILTQKRAIKNKQRTDEIKFIVEDYIMQHEHEKHREDMN